MIGMADRSKCMSFRAVSINSCRDAKLSPNPERAAKGERASYRMASACNRPIKVELSDDRGFPCVPMFPSWRLASFDAFSRSAEKDSRERGSVVASSPLS